MYCLKVERNPEYFANGVLVHNCGHLLVDEFWAVPVAAIDQALFGLRIGNRTTSAWGSTPKPTVSTRYVLDFGKAKPVTEGEELPDMGLTVVRRMRMSDNLENLAPGFVAQMRSRYAGTKHEKAELEGVLEENVEGALWKTDNFAWPGFRRRVYVPGQEKQWARENGSEIVYIVVAIDPTVSDPALAKNPYKEQDECGLIVAGMDREGHGYLLADLSLRADPTTWARAAIAAYNMFRANLIVYEKNQGGELVRQLLRTLSPNASIKAVHAADRKRARADPFHSLYEQGRFHHCNDTSHMISMLSGEMSPSKREEIKAAIRKTDSAFEALEGEMLSWDARDPRIPSPNRLDASVWAAHGLKLVTATGIQKRKMHS